MERITATLETDVVTAIRRVAGRRGVSRFLQTAARERLARLQLLEIADELDARYGKPEEAVKRQVSRNARLIFKR